MTTSFWSRDELSKQFSHCATVKEIITTLETDFESRGEVICEVRINGMILDDQDEMQFANNPIDGVNDLAVKSERPGDLIKGALASAAHLLPELEIASLSTADQLRGIDASKARDSFAQAIEGCQWLVGTLEHVRGAASGIGEPIESVERWLAAEKFIAQVVNEVSAAYGKGDSILVADLLEYELTAAITLWREVLEREIARRA
ncbi:MAG: hypothetical protein AAB250_19095 [Bdellovibrionota bacterium]